MLKNIPKQCAIRKSTCNDENDLIKDLNFSKLYKSNLLEGKNSQEPSLSPINSVVDLDNNEITTTRDLWTLDCSLLKRTTNDSSVTKDSFVDELLNKDFASHLLANEFVLETVCGYSIGDFRTLSNLLDEPNLSLYNSKEFINLFMFVGSTLDGNCKYAAIGLSIAHTVGYVMSEWGIEDSLDSIDSIDSVNSLYTQENNPVIDKTVYKEKYKEFCKKNPEEFCLSCKDFEPQNR